MLIVNRGTERVPFGFVYTDDERARAVFTITKRELTLSGSGSGYLRAFTPSELQSAKELLLQRYGLLEDPPSGQRQARSSSTGDIL